jgi:hypothetical protein
LVIKLLQAINFIIRNTKYAKTQYQAGIQNWKLRHTKAEVWIQNMLKQVS